MGENSQLIGFKLAVHNEKYFTPLRPHGSDQVRWLRNHQNSKRYI